MTNEEILLTAIRDGTPITEFQPQNNKQIYLARLCGLDVTLPEPDTIEEALLYLLCIDGGVGGGGSLKISDATYLFYNGYRLDSMEELMATLVSPTSADSMFTGATALKEVDMSGIDWSKCTRLSNAFRNTGLTRIDLSECDFSSVFGGSTVFYGCKDLVEIIGISFPKYKIMDDFFPKGTASEHCKLKRLTFKPGALSCGDINLSYCSFERDGAVELFNSLSDYSKVTGDDLPVQGYRRITLTGNPCVTGEMEIFSEQEQMAFNVMELFDRLFRNDIEEITVTTDLDEEKTVTLEELEEQDRYGTEYLKDEEFPVRFTVEVAETVPCETITEEDIAIATNKGWTVIK